MEERSKATSPRGFPVAEKAQNQRAAVVESRRCTVALLLASRRDGWLRWDGENGVGSDCYLGGAERTCCARQRKDGVSAGMDFSAAAVEFGVVTR